MKKNNNNNNNIRTGISLAQIRRGKKLYWFGTFSYMVPLALGFLYSVLLREEHPGTIPGQCTSWRLAPPAGSLGN